MRVSYWEQKIAFPAFQTIRKFIAGFPDGHYAFTQVLPKNRRLYIRFTLLLAFFLPLVGLIVHEMKTARLQSRVFSGIAREISYQVEPGRSPDFLAAPSGPYDIRFGYARLRGFLKKLEETGFRVKAQARPSARLLRNARFGLYPIYREKEQAGLQVTDRNRGTLYPALYPALAYGNFEEIPPVIVSSLLFIENRNLLDPRRPYHNPAVDWGRLSKAVGIKIMSLIDRSHKEIGGSTLATQLEKFRHSPEGRTASLGEKLRQMLSASLRAYGDGANTLPAQRRIICDYINSLPLAAVPGHGEVSGLGDGLWAWYGADFSAVNKLLADAFSPPSDEARALAFKQALSLIIAQRRPSHYLKHDLQALEELTDSYLRLLAEEGVIPITMKDAALRARLMFQQPSATRRDGQFVERKAVNLLRTQLLGQLGMTSLYDLDRLDLSVQSTLDMPAQNTANQTLQALHDPAYVNAAGLKESHLLLQGDPGGVTYAVTLYEKGDGFNLLRVQTDNLDQPLDVNEGAKLDLGSTAKLRTLISYLEIIATLHRQMTALPETELAALRAKQNSRLEAWAAGYLLAGEDKSLPTMLNAAMERKYSADPSEAFFTGGGRHVFNNFDKADNHRILTVRDALYHSVNLVFVRLMSDIVNYYSEQIPGRSPSLMKNPDDPQRQVYLVRFADREGSEYTRQFYRKHRGKNIGESLDVIIRSIRPSPARLATVLRSVDPSATPAHLKSLLATYLPGSIFSDADVDALYQKYSPDRDNLMDRSYIAGVHPLELWLANYLRSHPGSSLNEALAAGADLRQEVYQWLFKTRWKHAQDTRIKTMVEIEAFVKIHADWQRLGYPFASLVPSLATAIGSSGDRPAALAELMGIVVNDGVRLPTKRVEELHFAAGTPYETIVAPAGRQGERVLAPEIAATVRKALVGVVEQGTAQRLKKTLVQQDGVSHVAGGKTGTGDARFDVYAPGGRLVESRVVGRAATFVFMIDERFFGTVTAYVQGPQAAAYRFTSSLPVHVLGLLMPGFSPLIAIPGAPVPCPQN